MMIRYHKLALTATLGLAITLTLNACEEKEAAKNPTEPAAAAVEKTTAAAPETETACGKGGGSVKLPECITDADGRLLQKFEYDKQNRIVKIVSKTYSVADGELVAWNANTVTITYDTDDKITLEEVITKEYAQDKETHSVKKINAGTDTSTLNNEGYVYKDGNLIKETDGVNISEYSYDDKKSPFSNCKNPEWLLRTFGVFSNLNKNNILNEYTSGGEISFSKTYKYEYDREGFPTKITEETYVEGEEQTDTTYYTYYGSK